MYAVYEVESPRVRGKQHTKRKRSKATKANWMFALEPNEKRAEREKWREERNTAKKKKERPNKTHTHTRSLNAKQQRRRKRRKKRGENKMKRNGRKEKKNNTNIEKRMNAAKLCGNNNKKKQRQQQQRQRTAKRTKNFKRTNERAHERKQQKRIPNNDREHSQNNGAATTTGNGNSLGMCIWPDMRRERRAQTQNLYKIVCSLCFAYSDLVVLLGCTGSRYFLASDIVCMDGARCLGTERSLCHISTLCTLLSCTNDGVSVLSSTHIFLFQYKFCGAVVARCRALAYIVWHMQWAQLLLFRICFEACVLLNDRKFNIHRQAFVHLFSISAHKARRERERLCEERMKEQKKKQKAVSQPADTLTHFTWNTRIVVFAWLDCEG